MLAACNGAAPPEGITEVVDRTASTFLASPLPGHSEWLLCCRYEVTQAEFGQVLPDQASANLPVVMVNLWEAQEWAAEHDLRLPTAAEWEHLRLAGGAEDPAARTFANTLDLGLGRPLPVGVFERGRTSLGGYDFLGNVWEWTAESASGLRSGEASIFGGSFASYPVMVASQLVRKVHPLDRATDLGFRPVAGALDWITQHMQPAWQQAGPDGRARLAQALDGWRPEYRRQLARIYLELHPQQREFGRLLEGY